MARLTQYDRVLDFMESYGSITSMQAMRMGILRLSAIIFDLKKAGYDIVCTRRTVTNMDGSKVSIGVYHFGDVELKEDVENA